MHQKVISRSRACMPVFGDAMGGADDKVATRPRRGEGDMQSKAKAFVLGVSALFLGCAIASQAAVAEGALSSQAPVPEKMPFDIPYGESIDLATAKTLLAAAEAEAQKHNWKEAIAIVDPHGELVAFEKMDQTQFASITIAQRKARTSARFRRPTTVFSDMMDTGHANVATLDPDFVATVGGYPLVVEGKLIGAIGCSGATSGQDGVVCKAALDKLK
jgi:glc operon protein GlcG